MREKKENNKGVMRLANIKKVIIPAVGLGTHFLPATKAMLPIVDKPTIQYIIEEAIITGVGKLKVFEVRAEFSGVFCVQ